ncbi:GerMN domain-containing protein [Paenibacillus sp. TH7-28]
MRKMGYLLLIIALLALAGCGQKPAAMPADTGNPSNAAEGGAVDPSQGSGGEGAGQSDANGPQQTAEQVKLKVEVYFTDDDLMELQPVQREIEVPEGHTKYEEAFKALQSADQGLISLWEKVKLDSVAFSEANGELALDIELPDEARLGAGGEALAIEALKKTMFQFDEVKQIEVTVGGEKVESLMGHADLEHPITRE